MLFNIYGVIYLFAISCLSSSFDYSGIICRSRLVCSILRSTHNQIAALHSSLPQLSTNFGQMDDTSGPSAFNPVNPSTSLQQQQFWQPNRCQRILHLWHRRRAARELFGIQRFLHPLLHLGSFSWKSKSQSHLFSGRSSPSPFPLLHLLLSLCLLVQPTSCAGSRTNEIEVDWSGTTTAAEANTKAKSVSFPFSFYHIPFLNS
jgi:hypothetical protein